MAVARPVLAEIGERFRVNPENADLHAVEINSNPDGYEITARQHAIAFKTGRFIVKLRVPGGMFSRQFPERVEIGCAPVYRIRLRIDEPAADYQGGFVSATSLSGMPSEEQLVLPDDDGYELFSQLHLEVAALHGPVVEAMRFVAPNISEPTVVKYVSETASGIGYDYGLNNKNWLLLAL